MVFTDKKCVVYYVIDWAFERVSNAILIESNEIDESPLTFIFFGIGRNEPDRNGKT